MATFLSKEGKFQTLDIERKTPSIYIYIYIYIYIRSVKSIAKTYWNRYITILLLFYSILISFKIYTFTLFVILLSL